MPIYEYACRSCGRRLEVLHGIHADGPTTCEICGGTLTKVVSAPAIVFKGSGWAKKDARDRSAAHATAGDGKKADTPAAESAPADKGGATSARSGESAAASSGSAGSGSATGEGSPTGTGKSSPSKQSDR